MTDLHPRLARIASLKAKLKARDGKAEYKVSNEEIRQQIANLEKAHAEELANLERVRRDSPVQ